MKKTQGENVSDAQSIGEIHNYLNQDNSENRRETLQNMFFAALDHDTMNDVGARSAMAEMFRRLIELDEALEIVYRTDK